MADTKEVKKKEVQKIEGSKYQDFKEKFEEMINISRIAAIVDVACVARESVDSSKRCINTIVNKGTELAESFGRKAEDYMGEIGPDSPELDLYNDVIESIDEQFQDQVSLIIAEQKRAEALLENAMINKARQEYQRAMAMNTQEYKKYKLEMIKLNAKADSAKKLKNAVEKAKKLAGIEEEKENLRDRTPLNMYNQQIDEANRQIEAALKEMEVCEKALDDINNDYQKALEEHNERASSQTDLIEQEDGGFLTVLFSAIARLFRGNRVRQFLDAYESWIKGETHDLDKTVGAIIDTADKKFETLEQNVDTIEQNNLGRLSGIGRTIVESVKLGLNGVSRIGKTGVSAIITASETISKANSEKMFDGLDELSEKTSKTTEKNVKVKESTVTA